MPSATFTTTAGSGQLQFIKNNITNNTGSAITLSGGGGQDVVIDNTASATVTKKVNMINKGATNYYIQTSPALTAAAPATATVVSSDIVVTW